MRLLLLCTFVYFSLGNCDCDYQNCCGAPSWACVTLATDCNFPTAPIEDGGEGCNCPSSMSCCGVPTYACVQISAQCPNLDASSDVPAGVWAALGGVVLLGAAWYGRHSLVACYSARQTSQLQQALLQAEQDNNTDPNPAIPGTYDVFLSYRVWCDKEFVRTLYDRLSLKKLRVYLDQVELKDGEPWEKGFCDGLMNSRVFVPVLSKSCLSSMVDCNSDASCDNVLLEYRLASELKVAGRLKSVFPFLLGELDTEHQTFANFFQNFNTGSLPECPIYKVEAKVCEFMNTQLGCTALLTPTACRTVKGCVATLTENQAMIFRGLKEQALEVNVEKIVKTAMRFRQEANNELSRSSSANIHAK